MSKAMIQKMTARVFCQMQGGGNPVTIFSSLGAVLSSERQQELAKTCQWESVVVQQDKMSFYMPTGEEVSFCAHAAMGGAFAMKTPASSSSATVRFQPAMSVGEQTATIHEDNIVSLQMEATYAEQTFAVDPHKPTLMRILRDFCGLQPNQLRQPKGRSRLPSLVNASIARPKTLVYVDSIDTLHNIPAPRDPERFRLACDAIQSTGLYLYSKREDDDSFECRQFPRASGYPEDPATGIAAAALAVCLKRCGLVQDRYRFHQGTAMQQPSLIVVEDIREFKDDKVMFRLMGKVEVDSVEEIE